MTRFLLNGILALAIIPIVFAAGAVFSPDGNYVTILAPQGSEDLWRVDLKTKAIDKISLDLPRDQNIRSLVVGAEGELLLLTEEAIYVHDKKGTNRVCDTKGVMNADDLITVPPKAPNGMGDWLIVSGDNPNAKEVDSSRVYYARKPGGKAFEEVFGRRIQKVGEGVFTPNGRYIFLADNAVWEGVFSFDLDSGPGSRLVALVAANLAPLAYCDSNTSNTGKYSVGETVAIAGNQVYVALSGRHGADVLLRMTLPAKLPSCKGTDSAGALGAHYALQANVLSSVSVLGYDSRIESLAATVIKGEERVFYMSQNDNLSATKMMLWTSKTQKSRVIGEFKTDP